MSTVPAQRELKEIPAPDPELERRELQVAEGFEIQLYAADPLLAKPIQMNFDERGRLWIAASEVYPQIQPGQPATDKILVLDDQDGDGQADTTTVFADGLLIPTGVVPGHDGCYVANSTELLHLSDSDGDGRADRQRVVLSGFGTEDTHHILHTLRWGPDGALYMNQSIYIHSHIETPHGVRRMNGSGIWRFRPESMQLETFTLGLVNPWGHAWDRYGASFETDGAGGEGINYVFPGFVGVTSPGAVRIVSGLNPGKPKLCGLEIVGGSHLPDDWQGNLIANDFRAHRVCRYTVREQGSGFATEEREELVKSTHVAFRPIDVKMGPDGAIYIADWYNPIIQHGEVDFRDPRRDHVHGRIWRITAKGRPLVPRLDLTQLTTDELLALLASPEPWRRQHARLVLKERGLVEIRTPLDRWTESLASDADSVTQTDADLSRLEALWTYQSIDICPPELLRRLLESPQGPIRAAATRVLSHYHEQFSDALPLLALRVMDEHPRVRLEAVRALGRLADPHACEIAMRALALPQDRFLDFCLWQTARELEPHWLPALKRGEIDFGGNADQLTFALRAVQSDDVAPVLLGLLDSLPVDDPRLDAVFSVLTQVGDAQQLARVFAEVTRPDAPQARRELLLEQLIQAARQRKVVPAGELNALEQLLSSAAPSTQRLAVAATGAWRFDDLLPQIVAISLDATSPLREVAIDALAEIGTADSRNTLNHLIETVPIDALRLRAAAGVLRSDRATGVRQLAAVLSGAGPAADPAAAVAACLSEKGAAEQLAVALQGASLQRDVAMRAVRTVESSGRNEPELIAALTMAGQLTVSPWNLDPDALVKLLADAVAHGDPHRGERIYRRTDLSCQKCHAIGGAGGQVGPDLASIGASAQPDYVLESILDPGKKIKENYHSLIVETDEGKVATGIKIRESDTDLILRNAEDQEILVPLASIEGRSDGGSLMPRGLLDGLTRDELLDLVNFLTELGKVNGGFSLPREPFVRRWQVLQTDEGAAHTLSALGLTRLASHPADFQWQPVYSLVAGQLPLDDLPQHLVAPGQAVTAVRSLFELENATRLSLQVDRPAGVSIWVDQQSLMPEEVQVLELPAGPHQLTLVIDRLEDREPVGVRLAPAAP